MHPSLQQVYTLSESTMVEKFEFQVQLQHCQTCFRDRLTGVLAITTLPQSPVGGFPFLFSPPYVLAAVDHYGTPPTISCPSRVQSDIGDQYLHQEILPAAHKRRHKAIAPLYSLGFSVCFYVCQIGIYKSSLTKISQFE